MLWSPAGSLLSKVFRQHPEQLRTLRPIVKLCPHDPCTPPSSSALPKMSNKINMSSSGIVPTSPLPVQNSRNPRYLNGIDSFSSKQSRYALCLLSLELVSYFPPDSMYWLSDDSDKVHKDCCKVINSSPPPPGIFPYFDL